jgi:hypothetical protein
MDHPAGGTCDQTPQRACRRERHAPGRGTSLRQSPWGRNVTPDLGAERIDGAEVEHWRHEALLERRAVIDTAGAHRGTRRGALLHRTARRRTRRTHRVVPIDAGPRTREHDGRPPARQPSRLPVSPGRRAAWTLDFDSATVRRTLPAAGRRPDRRSNLTLTEEDFDAAEAVNARGAGN